MRVRLLGPDDREWGEVLSRTPHDFYHLPAYVALCASQEDARPHALLVERADDLLLQPLLLRPLPEDLRTLVDGYDATSPYGYSGPLIVGSPEFVRPALEAASEYLTASGVIAAFIRSHPLLNDGLPECAPIGVWEDHGETVVVDLSESDEEHWHQTRSGHRNEINKAIRTGQIARMDVDWVHAKRFAEIYRQTMERVSASSYYNFADSYFEGLRSALGSRLYLCSVEVEGEVAAGGLFTEVSGIVQYHLSGTDERFIRQRPNKLMLHFVRGWAKARGNRWLHLGGGVGGGTDSLFRFKSGFSSGRRRFHTLRLVCRPDAYRSLVSARHGDSGRLDGRGFFPEYRRTVSC